MVSPARRKATISFRSYRPLIVSAAICAGALWLTPQLRADVVVALGTTTNTPANFSGSFVIPSGSYTLSTPIASPVNPVNPITFSSTPYYAAVSPPLPVGPNLPDVNNTVINQLILAPPIFPNEVFGQNSASIGLSSNVSTGSGTLSLNGSATSSLSQVFTITNPDAVSDSIHISATLLTDDGSSLESVEYTPTDGQLPSEAYGGSSSATVLITSDFGYNPSLFTSSFDTGLLIVPAGKTLTITATANDAASFNGQFELANATISRNANSSFDVTVEAETTPEPTTLGIMAAGGFILLGKRQKKWARQGRQS